MPHYDLLLADDSSCGRYKAGVMHSLCYYRSGHTSKQCRPEMLARLSTGPDTGSRQDEPTAVKGYRTKDMIFIHCYFIRYCMSVVGPRRQMSALRKTADKTRHWRQWRPILLASESRGLIANSHRPMWLDSTVELCRSLCRVVWIGYYVQSLARVFIVRYIGPDVPDVYTFPILSTVRRIYAGSRRCPLCRA